MSRRTAIGLVGAAAIAAGVAILGANWQRLIGADGAGAETLTIPTDDPELAAAGAPLYADACADCHGADLEGASTWRQPNADGTLPPPPHDETGHTWHHPDGYLFAYTKFGGRAFMPEGRQSAMPGFADRLSDREILAILAYIKSEWPAEVREKQARITDQAVSRQ